MTWNQKHLKIMSALLLIGAAALGLLLAGLLVSAPTTLDLTEAEAEIYFTIDRPAFGGCVQATWRVAHIREVYLNGAGQVGEGAESLCLNWTQRPTLTVKLQDGSVRAYYLGINWPLALWLLGGALACLGSGLLLRREHTQNYILTHLQDASPAKTRAALALAAATAALCLARSLVIADAYSVGLAPDTGQYLSGSQLVTWCYPLLTRLTGALDDIMRLVWVNVLLAAAAAGALVYVVGRCNLILAGGIGFFLVFDLTWAVTGRWILSESPFTSFYMLSLALFLDHYRRRERLRAVELGAAGALYGVAASIRPAGALFVVVIVLGYLWLTRRLQRAALAAAGMAAVFVFGAFVNLGLTGSFRLWGGTGLYTSLSLFTNDLFLPENGPVSQAIYAQMQQCDLEPQCKTLPLNGPSCVMPIIYCLEAWGDEANAAKLGSAYTEAILSRPLAFAEAVLRGAVQYLSVPVGDVTVDGYFWLWPTNDEYCRMFELAGCDALQRTTPAQVVRRDAAYDWVMGTLPYTLYTTQAHLALAAALTGQPVHQLTPAAVALAWGALIALLLGAAGGQTRVMAAACLLFIHYLAFTTAAASVILPRYAQTLSPFYIVLSVTAALSLARLAFMGAVSIGEAARNWLSSRTS